MSDQVKYKCSKEGCQNKRTAKGLCQKHYDRMRSNYTDRRFAQLLRKARQRELEVSVSSEYVDEVAKKGCTYCGSKRISYGHGIDRIDSSKGYTKENIIGCCGNCNILKSHLLSLSETKSVIELLKRIRGVNLWEEPEIIIPYDISIKNHFEYLLRINDGQED
jgi:hypothetical protein